MHGKRKQKTNKCRVLIIGRRRRGGSLVLPTEPTAPINLVLQAETTYLHLAWEHTSADEDGFRIYRQAFDGPFEVVAEIIADQTEFYDGNVEMGVLYTYYIVAFNSAGHSAPSNQVSGEIGLGA